MTYRGAKPIIRKSTINVSGTLALINASLNMKKLLTALTILNTVAAVTAFAGIVYVYWYVNNETKQEQMKKFVGDKIMEQLPNLMPDALDNALPNMTGGSIPIEKPDMKF